MVILKSRRSRFLKLNGLSKFKPIRLPTQNAKVDAVRRLVVDVIEGFEEGKIPAVALCDLSKIFDCINHRLLNATLWNFFIFRGLALQFFFSYLRDRQQCTMLGPISFSIYINYHLLPDTGLQMIPLLYVPTTKSIS